MTLILLSSVALPSRAEATWNRALPREAYEALGRCETGGKRGNPRHWTKSYVGAFGFYKRTWDAFADTPHQRARELTWEQQTRILDRVFWYGHTEKRGPRAGRKQYAVGPWGHGCFKSIHWIQELVCKHGKQAVRRWCR